MARIKFFAALGAALLMPLLLVAPAFAQSIPQKEQQTVYNAELFDGQGYGGQFYSQNDDTIYVMANVQNVLTPKTTLVYWWPLTHEYKADFSSLNEPITATLEIGDQKFPQQTYSLRYNGGYDSAKTSLLIGDDATTQFATYQKSLDDYQAAQKKYSDDWNTFQNQLLVYGQMKSALEAKNESTDSLVVPQQPVAPVQPSLTVATPDTGNPFTVAVGEYQIQLRGADGNVIAGSQHKMVAFDPRRQGVAYKVIASDKWTTPDTSVDPNDTIFVSGEKALYMQPAPESEYDTFYASKLMNSQDRSTLDQRGTWTWLPAGQFSGATLALDRGIAASETLTRTMFYVKQTNDGALGYDIKPLDSSVSDGDSTFAAFMVQPKDGAMTVAAPGVANSGREIRVVHTAMGNVLIGLAFAPLVLGAAWLSYRRWSTR